VLIMTEETPVIVRSLVKRLREMVPSLAAADVSLDAEYFPYVFVVRNPLARCANKRGAAIGAYFYTLRAIVEGWDETEPLEDQMEWLIVDCVKEQEKIFAFCYDWSEYEKKDARRGIAAYTLRHAYKDNTRITEFYAPLGTQNGGC